MKVRIERNRQRTDLRGFPPTSVHSSRDKNRTMFAVSKDNFSLARHKRGYKCYRSAGSVRPEIAGGNRERKSMNLQNADIRNVRKNKKDMKGEKMEERNNDVHCTL